MRKDEINDGGNNYLKFVKFLDVGMLTPVKFTMGATFMYRLSLEYEVSSTSSASTASDALTAGIEAGFGTASASADTTMRKETENKLGSMKSHSTLIVKAQSYGGIPELCDWDTIMNDKEHQNGAIQSCADSAKGDFANINNVVSIPKGGFVDLSSVIFPAATEIPASQAFVEAVNGRYTRCQCENPGVPGAWKNGYRCWEGSDVGEGSKHYCNDCNACVLEGEFWPYLMGKSDGTMYPFCYGEGHC